MNIIVVMPTEERHRDLLKNQVPGAKWDFVSPGEVTTEMMEQADAIVGNVSPQVLSQGKNLKLVQLNSAGTDHYLEPGILPQGAVLCNATGAYGLAIAEYLLGCTLSLQKKLELYRDKQKEHRWEDLGKVRPIYGSTTLVIGLGNIGGEYAKRMTLLGSHVIGVRRTPGPKPEYVEECYTMDELPRLVGRADVIASILPGTKETTGIYHKDFFRQMKSTAIFLNAGRGSAVKTTDLLEALEEGIIAGAALDVTDPEPLPKDHPLWDQERVIITPHTSGGYHLTETQDAIVSIAAWNLKAMMQGGEMMSVVDLSTGYRRK